MKKQTHSLALYLFLTIVLAACGNGAAPMLEVTRLAPQTVEVTRLVPQTAIITRTPKPTAIPYALDTAYYEGMIVITQYYTFLGHGLYREAYGLKSSSAQRYRSLEEFVALGKDSFKTVEIVTIEPLNERLEREGAVSIHITPDALEKKWFFVEIKVWGRNMLTGFVISGELQTHHISVIKEAGQWKIDR